MILQDAYEAAQRYLDEEVRPYWQVEIVIASCEDRGNVWTFGYNSRLLLEVKDISSAVVGSGPIVVPKSGEEPYIATWFEFLDKE